MNSDTWLEASSNRTRDEHVKNRLTPQECRAISGM